MKKIFLLIATLGVLLSSCLKDEAYIAIPTIAEINVTPSTVSPGKAAIISAKITNDAYIVDKSEITVSSATLFYRVGDNSETSVTMTASGNIFSAEIPASVNSDLDVEVLYRIEASNNRNQTAKSAILKYTVGAAAIDYTKLKLNEISGVGADGEKFYELINIGTEDINLEGCQIFYNGNAGVGLAPPVGDGTLTWTGASDQTSKAGKLFLLYGRNNPGSFTSGLTAARSIRITFKDPAGNIIDEFLRPSDTGIYEIIDKSFSRVPDGSGLFYFTTPTPNVTNGTSTEGLLPVPGQGAPEPEQPTDYTKLKLNEISGVGDDPDKFYELINTGTEDINLEGCKIYYNANGSIGSPAPTGDGNLTWTGAADQAIEAGKLLTLLGRNATGETNPNKFNTGLTAGRNIRITLKDPNDNIIDEFVRGADTGDYAIGDKSYSRIVDGTGDFYFTAPTPNEMNGTSTAGLLLVPDKEVTTPDPTVDYSQLVMNEIDGNSKSIELFNKGTVAIPLEGVALVKNDGTSSWWTGVAANGSIPAGGYIVIIQSNTDALLSGNAGISPKQNLKYELKDPSGNVISSFLRSNGGALGDGISDTAPNSYQRCPNGTGDWKLAAPTNGSANPATGTDIPQN